MVSPTIKFFAVILIVSFLITGAAAGAEKAIESYTATVANMPGVGSKPYQIKIQITGYTPEDDVTKLAQVLRSSGQDALKKALDSYHLGTLAPYGKMGNDLNYVREIKTEKGRTLRMISNRDMDFFELKYNGRSTDFPFSMVELTISKDGKMEGRIIAAARIQITKENTLDVEALGMQPMYLVSLRKTD